MAQQETDLNQKRLNKQAEFARLVIQDRTKNWLTPEGALKRPTWLDRQRKPAKSVRVEPGMPSTVLAQGKKTDERIFRYAQRLRRSIERSEGIMEAAQVYPTILQEEAALNELKTARPGSVSPEIVKMAEAQYNQFLAEHGGKVLQQGIVFLQRQALERQKYAEWEQKQEVTALEAAKTSKRSEGPRYELATGIILYENRARLLRSLSARPLFAPVLKGALLRDVYGEGEQGEKKSHAFDVLANETKKLLEAKSDERLISMTHGIKGSKRRVTTEYVLVPHQAGFTNWELSSLTSFLQQKMFEIKELNITPIAGDLLKDIRQQTLIDTSQRLTTDEIQLRRQELFAKVNALLHSPFKDKIIAAVENSNPQLGKLLLYINQISEALITTQEKPSLVDFLTTPKGTHVTIDGKSRLIITEEPYK